jgi:fructose-bisphosphate aldolase class II
MKTLREYVAEANEKKIAIGHFNISNIEGLWAIFNAARKLNVPVIIGVSEGERDFIGVKQAVALVKSLRDEYDYPIFLNADHTYSFERVKEAVDAGYDSVIFDGAKLPIEENIKLAKQCREYAKFVHPKMLVEAELGYIGQSSKEMDKVPDGIQMTSAEEAKSYVDQTRIDMFAPAVGNVHGIILSGEPALNIERIAEIKKAVGIPLVLHGASGNSDSDIRKAIEAGINIVHINTEIRVAYRDALQKFVKANPKEVAPYKIMKDSVAAMEAVVEKKLKLFNNL